MLTMLTEWEIVIIAILIEPLLIWLVWIKLFNKAPPKWFNTIAKAILKIFKVDFERRVPTLT